MPNGYPDRPIIIDVEKIPKHREVIEALKKFKAMNPWRGTPEERYRKFKWLHEQLNRIYGLGVKFVSEVRLPYTFSGASSYSPGSNTITLRGRYSVITFLHEWGHALECNGVELPDGLRGEHWAVAFSVTLFKHVFPEKYARLQAQSHVLVRR